MTTGRINQVARKVSTPKPRGNGTQTLGQAQRSTRSGITAHRARKTHHESHTKTDRQCNPTRNQSRQAQITTAVTDQTSLAATCGETINTPLLVHQSIHASAKQAATPTRPRITPKSNRPEPRNKPPLGSPNAQCTNRTASTTQASTSNQRGDDHRSHRVLGEQLGRELGR